MAKFAVALLSLFVVFQAGIASAALPKVIVTCDDGDEWPPYTYFNRVDGKKTSEVTGYSVDLLKAVLKTKNISLMVELIPWKRCLEKIKSGKTMAALNATVNEERKKDFIISKPYYLLSEAYIASTAKPPVINSAADMLKYNICGQRGYNYDYLGVFPKNIHSLVDEFPAAIKLIKTGRCDLMPVNREIIIGYHVIGEPDFVNDPELLVVNIPKVPGTPYVMMISKKVEFGNELLTVIEEGLQALEKNGVAKQLRHKYKIE